MLGPGGLLFAAAGGALGVDGPDAAPTDVSWFFHDGDKIGVQWANGDPTAATQIYFRDEVSGCPSVLPDDLTFIGTAPAGATSFDTTGTISCSHFIRHVKNGQFSAFVQAINGPTTCLTCPV